MAAPMPFRLILTGVVPTLSPTVFNSVRPDNLNRFEGSKFLSVRCPIYFIEPALCIRNNSLHFGRTRVGKPLAAR